MATSKAQQEKPSLVQAADGAGGALEQILAPLAQGDGYRHGALGAPGYGKTHHLRNLVAGTIARGAADLVVVHDVKGAVPEFPAGTLVAFPRDVVTRASDLERTRTLVVRGDPLKDQDAPVEEVASRARTLARAGLHVLMVVSELDNALTDGGRAWSAPAVRWWSSQARRLQGSLLWSAQQPKRTPDEIFDQSSSIAFFHLEARASNYLGGTLLLDERMVARLPQLEVGEFVLWIQGAGWNGRTYRWAM